MERMIDQRMPSTQRELIRTARGELTKAEFARQLGIHPSSLSKYESEHLGASTKVLNYCLRLVATRVDGVDAMTTEVERALALVRQAAAELEMASRSLSAPSRRA
jgi:transcriptional regulator with XRE-family HTH domain